MAHHYQFPSPTSSDENGSIISVGLSRQRSDSAEFPTAKRTRSSQHKSVDEWAASLGQAELSGMTVDDSPDQLNELGHTAQSSLPTPASTPPHLATLAAGLDVSAQEPSSSCKTATVTNALDRATKLSAEGAFGPAESGVEAPKARSVRSADEADKDRFVAGLVGASCLAIQSLWGPKDRADGSATGSGVLPIQFFVKEVLRRSRTSCSTLQLALYYLHKSRRQIREVVAKADASRPAYQHAEREFKTAYPSPPLGSVDGHALDVGARFAALLATQNSPLLCGRRMFLASLIAASKYLQDRNYSNKAWARISGLPVNEINVNERIFLGMMGFQLHLKADDFARWAARLAELTPQPSHNQPTAGSALSGLQPSATESASAEPLHDVHGSPPLVAAPEGCTLGLSSRSKCDPNPNAVRASFLAPGAPQYERAASPADSTVSSETVSSYASSSSDGVSDVTSPASSVSSLSRKICRMPNRAFKAPAMVTKEQLANTHWTSGVQNTWSTFGWQAGAAH